MKSDNNLTIQEKHIKELKDAINDLTLIVEMYMDDYPFDADHKKKHKKIVDYACLLIGKPRTIEELKQMVLGKKPKMR